MKFSTKAEYGLKAMVCLARDYPDQKNIKAICAKEHISEKYLERLIGELRKNKIVISQKGKGGGYTLAKKPNQIKVGEIVEILEGPIAPMKCVGHICSMQDECTSNVVWNKLGEQIKKTLYGIKLSELI
jgi:Rrf2 family transcriptional regulator, cysteine metabolism repressor